MNFILALVLATCSQWMLHAGNPPGITAAFKDSLPVFTNKEMVEYCLPVPLKEYHENVKMNTVKGKHVFIHKTKKGNSIILQGLLRSDTSISLENYFQNTFPANAEEEGRIFEEKGIIPGTNRFYAKGYWSNYYYRSRFIEIGWLRPDEFITYQVTYSVSDSLLWNKRLRYLLKTDANCH